jgi:hypothetical protein
LLLLLTHYQLALSSFMDTLQECFSGAPAWPTSHNLSPSSALPDCLLDALVLCLVVFVAGMLLNCLRFLRMIALSKFWSITFGILAYRLVTRWSLFLFPFEAGFCSSNKLVDFSCRGRPCHSPSLPVRSRLLWPRL